MSFELEKIFNSDGLHRRIIKHNKNYSTLSACTSDIINNFLPLSGGSLTGPVYAPLISGGTIYSGGTDLSLVFAPYGVSVSGGTGDITRAQDGINTFTGGTDNYPTVNVTGLTIDNISVSGDASFVEVSATTIYSSGTDLSEIFAPYGISVSGETGDITRVQPGSNITTGGTDNYPVVNVVGSPIFTSVTASEISGTSISGVSIYSAGTDLTEIFAPIGISVSGGTGDITRVQGGINTFTGGTDNYPTVNVTGLSIDNITVSGDATFNTISAATIIQGDTVIGGVISSDVAPNVEYSGSTWIRTTDYENFIYDPERGKWLSVGVESFGGSRSRANQSNIFLRYFNGTPFNITPFRAPYDMTLVNVVSASRDIESWNAVISTGISVSTDYVYVLPTVLSRYKSDDSVNVDVLSGETVYLYMSGTSISYPSVYVYFKRKG